MVPESNFKISFFCSLWEWFVFISKLIGVPLRQFSQGGDSELEGDRKESPLPPAHEIAIMLINVNFINRI
jgi:hypothetical protein